MSRSTHMVRAGKQNRRLTIERWCIRRWDEQIGKWEEFEITCEAGEFFRHYRMLGRVDDTLSSDAPEITLFDPQEDSWSRVLVESWVEVVLR